MVMLDFIVLGLVPGSNFQLGFFGVIVFDALCIILFVSAYKLRRHDIRKFLVELQHITRIHIKF